MVVEEVEMEVTVEGDTQVMFASIVIGIISLAVAVHGMKLGYIQDKEASRGSVGMVENGMETTIVYRGYIVISG